MICEEEDQKGRTDCSVHPSASAPSGQPHHVSRFVTSPFLVEGQRLQSRLVAGDEKEDRILIGSIHMLAPGAARHRKRVEFLPVEALSIDDGMSLAAEWRDKKACRLAQGES